MANISIKGGDKWRKALSKLAQDKVIKVRAGVLEGAKTTDGKSVATYAAYNEFGTDNIPARPFMRNTLTRESENWERGLGAFLARGMTPEEALKAVGARMAEDIRKTIDESIDIEENAPSTVRKKTRKATGGQKGETDTPRPLVDKGNLRRSINWEIEK